MKLQDLPAELIVKVFNVTDQSTFEQLKFANKNIHTISKLDYCRFQFIKEITCEYRKFYVVSKNGNREEVWAEHLRGPRTKAPTLREVEHVKCLRLKNFEIHSAIFTFYLKITFPKLRSIKRLCIESCKGSYFDLEEFLVTWNIKDFIMSNSSGLYTFFTDKLLSPLRGTIWIEAPFYDQYSEVSDTTLKSVLAEKRPVFKLKGLTVKISLNGVLGILENLDTESTIDWYLGTLYGPTGFEHFKNLSAKSNANGFRCSLTPTPSVEKKFITEIAGSKTRFITDYSRKLSKNTVHDLVYRRGQAFKLPKKENKDTPSSISIR